MDVYIKRKDILSLAKKGYLVGNGNYQSVKNYINSIPAADVVERKTGKWYGNKRHQRCSLCGITYCVPDGESGEIDMSDYHYCPNCGARMEG